MASISRVTSISGTPRGAGGIPSRTNSPKRLLSFVTARPSKTWIKTPGWLSAEVVNACTVWWGSSCCVQSAWSGSTCCLPAQRMKRRNQQQQHLHLDDPSLVEMAACTAAPIAKVPSREEFLEHFQCGPPSGTTPSTNVNHVQLLTPGRRQRKGDSIPSNKESITTPPAWRRSSSNVNCTHVNVGIDLLLSTHKMETG